MRRYGTPSSLCRTSAAALCVAALAGCVTRGTYEEVLGQRDALQTEKGRLEQKLKLLERSNRSLDSERAELVDQVEDLRGRNEALEKDVEKLRRAESLLSRHLRDRDKKLEELQQLRATYESLVSDLESEVAAGQIEIEQLREGLRLNLTQDILFASGSAELNEEGAALLRKVSKQLQGMAHEVEVQGHTDNVPVSPSLARRFPSNWELAAARAAGVVRLFEDEGIDPTRLVATSHGEHRPVASNATPEGRSRNRRIEIRLSPAPSVPAKPAGETAPAS